MKIKSTDWGKLILELFVVFLGITGGFLLNNWRAEQQQKHIEKSYIDGFIQNVDSTIVELERTIIEESKWLPITERYILSLNSTRINKDSVSRMFQHIVNTSTVILPKNTYEDIKYSGNLNLIRDFRLKEQIVKYYLQMEGLDYIDKYFNDYFRSFVLTFVMDNFSFTKRKILDQKQFNQEKYLNVVVGYYSIRQQRLDAFKELLEDSKELKIDLARAINN